MNDKSKLDKEFDMKIKNIAASAAMVGALGLGALAIGGGVAQADPNPWPPATVNSQSTQRVPGAAALACHAHR